MKKNTLIEVEWDDIVYDSTWLSEHKAANYPTAKCKTMGYFLNQTKKVLRLSATIQFDKDNERDITVIPLGVIKKIRRLK